MRILKSGLGSQVIHCFAFRKTLRLYFFTPQAWKRWAAVWTLFFFITANPQVPAALAFAPVESAVHLSAQEFPTDLATLKTPQEFGEVVEFFKGTNEQSVILIQDAHAIPDAQRNIQRLIDYFQKEHGVNLVALEGASARLDPTLFKSFPDKKILCDVFQTYYENGELAGGTAAAIFNTAPSAYFGLENKGVYAQGVSHYLRALKSETVTLKQIARQKIINDEIKQKIYSDELLRVDSAVEDFYTDKKNLLEVLNVLANVREPARGSQLSVLLEEGRRHEDSADASEAEVEKIAETVKAYLSSGAVSSRAPSKEPGAFAKSISKDRRFFSERQQAFQTAGISVGEFALCLRSLIRKYEIPVQVSDSLKQRVIQQKRLRDIGGTKLFAEFETYADDVKGSLFQSEQEGLIDRVGQKLRILERLAKLELSQEDWQAAKRLITQHQFDDEDDQDGSKDYEMITRLKSQIDFYVSAKKRDKIFHDNLLTLMAKEKAKLGLMVAGGFHTEGLVQRLKAESISYLLVRPRIQTIPEQNNYRAHMQGDVSWKDYFEVKNGKVNLHDAFVRGTRDRLLGASRQSSVLPARPRFSGGSHEQKQNTSPIPQDTGHRRGESDSQSTIHDPSLLKNWRDQIIRDLAAQGRIAESGRYTRFIDEIASSSFQLRPSNFERLNVWKANVERFIQGLRNLKTQNELTESNVAKLLQPAMIPAVVTSAGAMLSEQSIVKVGLLPSLLKEMREGGRIEAEGARPEAGGSVLWRKGRKSSVKSPMPESESLAARDDIPPSSVVHRPATAGKPSPIGSVSEVRKENSGSFFERQVDVDVGQLRGGNAAGRVQYFNPKKAAIFGHVQNDAFFNLNRLFDVARLKTYIESIRLRIVVDFHSLFSILPISGNQKNLISSARVDRFQQFIIETFFGQTPPSEAVYGIIGMGDRLLDLFSRYSSFDHSLNNMIRVVKKHAQHVTEMLEKINKKMIFMNKPRGFVALPASPNEEINDLLPSLVRRPATAGKPSSISSLRSEVRTNAQVEKWLEAKRALVFAGNADRVFEAVYRNWKKGAKKQRDRLPLVRLRLKDTSDESLYKKEIKKILETGGVLMLDLRDADPKLIKEWNSIYDEDASGKGAARISQDLKIIAIADQKSQESRLPASVISRSAIFYEQVSGKDEWQDPVAAFQTVSAETPAAVDAYVLDLYGDTQSSFWRRSLLEGVDEAEAGSLLRAMQEGKELVLIGIPEKNVEFLDFLRQLQIQRRVYHRGRWVKARKGFVLRTHARDYAEGLSGERLLAEGEKSGDQVFYVNRYTAGLLLRRNVFENKRLKVKPGFLETWRGDAVRYVVTENLPDGLWNRLMTHPDFKTLEIRAGVDVPQAYRGLRTDRLKAAPLQAKDKDLPPRSFTEVLTTALEKGAKVLVLEGEDVDVLYEKALETVPDGTPVLYKQVTPYRNDELLWESVQQTGVKEFEVNALLALKMIEQDHGTLILSGIESREDFFRQQAGLLAPEPYLLIHGRRVPVRGRLILLARQTGLKRALTRQSAVMHWQEFDALTKEILIKEGLSPAEYGKIQSVLKTMDSIPPSSLRAGRANSFYPEWPLRGLFKLRRLVKEFNRQRDWVQAFDLVYGGDYGLDEEVRAMIRVRVRKVFGSPQQQVPAIDGRKLDDTLNEMGNPTKPQGYEWRLLDTLNTAALSGLDVRESFGFSNLSGSGALKKIQTALIADAATREDPRHPGLLERTYRKLFGIQRTDEAIAELAIVRDKKTSAWQVRETEVHGLIDAGIQVLFFQGAPGLGKSHLIQGIQKKYGPTRPITGPFTAGPEMRYQQAELEAQKIAAWVESKTGILLIDEANLLPEAYWDFLREVLLTHPGLAVIFSGNETFQPGRHRIPLVEEMGVTLYFKDFDEADLRAIVESYTEDLPEPEETARVMLDLHHFFQAPRFGQTFTPRDLQELADWARFFGHRPADIVMHAWRIYSPAFTPEERDVLSLMLRKKYGVDPNHTLKTDALTPKTMNMEMLRADIKKQYGDGMRQAGIELSEGALALAAEIIRLRELAEQRGVAGLWTFGKRGAVIESEAGWGKDDVLVKTLEVILGYPRLDPNALELLPDQIPAAGVKGYYVLNAEMDDRTLDRVVKRAMREGAVLIIRELNGLDPGAVESKLNDLLTGSRKVHPAFFVFMTINQADVESLSPFSSAFLSRVHFWKPLPHSRSMLEAMGAVRSEKEGWLVSGEILYKAAGFHVWLRDRAGRTGRRPTTREFYRALAGIAQSPKDWQSVLREVYAYFMRQAETAIDDAEAQSFLSDRAENYIEKSPVNPIRLMNGMASFLVPLHIGAVDVGIDPRAAKERGAAAYWKAPSNGQNALVALDPQTIIRGDWPDSLVHEGMHGAVTVRKAFPEFDIDEEFLADVEDLRKQGTFLEGFPRGGLRQLTTPEDSLLQTITATFPGAGKGPWAENKANRLLFRQLMAVIVKTNDAQLSAENLKLFAENFAEGAPQRTLLNAALKHFNSIRELADSYPSIRLAAEAVYAMQLRALEIAQSIEDDYLKLPEPPQNEFQGPSFDQGDETEKTQAALNALASQTGIPRSSWDEAGEDVTHSGGAGTLGGSGRDDIILLRDPEGPQATAISRPAIAYQAAPKPLREAWNAPGKYWEELLSDWYETRVSGGRKDDEDGALNLDRLSQVENVKDARERPGEEQQRKPLDIVLTGALPSSLTALQAGLFERLLMQGFRFTVFLEDETWVRDISSLNRLNSYLGASAKTLLIDEVRARHRLFPEESAHSVFTTFDALLERFEPVRLYQAAHDLIDGRAAEIAAAAFAKLSSAPAPDIEAQLKILRGFAEKHGYDPALSVEYTPVDGLKIIIRENYKKNKLSPPITDEDLAIFEGVPSVGLLSLDVPLQGFGLNFIAPEGLEAFTALKTIQSVPDAWLRRLTNIRRFAAPETALTESQIKAIPASEFEWLNIKFSSEAALRAALDKQIDVVEMIDPENLLLWNMSMDHKATAFRTYAYSRGYANWRHPVETAYGLRWKFSHDVIPEPPPTELLAVSDAAFQQKIQELRAFAESKGYDGEKAIVDNGNGTIDVSFGYGSLEGNRVFIQGEELRHFQGIAIRSFGLLDEIDGPGIERLEPGKLMALRLWNYKVFPSPEWVKRLPSTMQSLILPRARVSEIGLESLAGKIFTDRLFIGGAPGGVLRQLAGRATTLSINDTGHEMSANLRDYFVQHNGTIEINDASLWQIDFPELIEIQRQATVPEPAAASVPDIEAQLKILREFAVKHGYDPDASVSLSNDNKKIFIVFIVNNKINKNHEDAPEMTDDDLMIFEGITALTLFVSDVPINGYGLSHLHPENLDLMSVFGAMQPPPEAWLRRLTGIRHLSIPGTVFSKAQIEAIPKKKLEKISIGLPNISSVRILLNYQIAEVTLWMEEAEENVMDTFTLEYAHTLGYDDVHNMDGQVVFKNSNKQSPELVAPKPTPAETPSLSADAFAQKVQELRAFAESKGYDGEKAIVDNGDGTISVFFEYETKKTPRGGVGAIKDEELKVFQGMDVLEYRVTLAFGGHGLENIQPQKLEKVDVSAPLPPADWLRNLPLGGTLISRSDTMSDDQVGALGGKKLRRLEFEHSSNAQVETLLGQVGSMWIHFPGQAMPETMKAQIAALGGITDLSDPIIWKIHFKSLTPAPVSDIPAPVVSPTLKTATLDFPTALSPEKTWPTIYRWLTDKEVLEPFLEARQSAGLRVQAVIPLPEARSQTVPGTETGSSPLRSEMRRSARAVVDALDPRAAKGGRSLTPSEIQTVYKLAATNLEEFIDAILQVWEARNKAKISMDEDNLGMAQAALAESKRLLKHLRQLRRSDALPEGLITVGLRLSGGEDDSFLGQLVKVLQRVSEKAEVMVEADLAKKLSIRGNAGLAIRPVSATDWRRGLTTLRSREQEDVPVALSFNLLGEGLNAMFMGLALNRSEAGSNPLSDDFQGLLMAVSLVEIARISAEPNHRSELRRLSGQPRAKADYLRVQLLKRLDALGYPADMFAAGNGYLTLEGVAAEAYLAMKARAEVRQAA